MECDDPQNGIYRTTPAESELLGQPRVALTWKEPEALLRAIRTAKEWYDGPRGPLESYPLNELDAALTVQQMERQYVDLREGLTDRDAATLLGEQL